MPELPEVQTIVNTLRPRLLARAIRAVVLRRTDIVTPPDTDLRTLLTGRTIETIERRGKRIVFTLDDASRFYLHLGMTGRLTVHDAAEPLAPHTHLLLDFGDRELRFNDARRFGGVYWVGPDNHCDHDIGP